MWKHRSDVAREIAEVLSETLTPGVRVIGIGPHAEVLKNAALQVLNDTVKHDAETVLLIAEGIGSLSDIMPGITEWRAKGIRRIVVGVGVMPSHLVEPVKKVVEEIFVLKIPRLFQNVGQYFEGID